MRPKGKLFVLFAIFAALGLVTATGAFTTVSAQRTATVNVADDASALLALTAAPTTDPADGSFWSPNGEYASQNADGELEIDFDTGAGATGINLDALTTIEGVFLITNQGTQSVDVWVEQDTTNVADADITFYNHDNGAGTADTTSLEGGATKPTNAVTLGTGESVVVSIELDSRDTSSLNTQSSFTVDLTVHAEATA